MGRANNAVEFYESLRGLALSGAAERSIKVSRGMRAFLQGGMVTLIELCREFFPDERLSQSDTLHGAARNKPTKTTPLRGVSQEIVNVLTEIAMVNMRAVL